MRTRSAPFWHLPWRFALFLLLCADMIPLVHLFDAATGIMLGFDSAASVFIATLVPLFRHDVSTMRLHARQNDANRTTILIVTGLVMVAMLALIASELRQKVAPSTTMVALIVVTLALAWLFSNLVYTLHYAFLYYGSAPSGKDCGGLSVPERPEPDYWDFAYFALTLGMTFQTSDVAIASPHIRRVALCHSFAAFVFNLGVIAFTINIIGG
jgi:uncharacterized membrane protein